MSSRPGSRLRRWPLAQLAFVLLTAMPAAAQSVGEPIGVAASDAPSPVMTRDASGAVVVRATRIRTPIKIDGKLDDAAYQEVQAISDFIQQEPNDGAPVSERTDVWVLFDDENLYVSCRCSDTHPERILSNDMRRDSNNSTQQDQLGLVLDTFHDRRNGFLFQVSPIGGLRDGEITDERPNINWNGVWDAKASRFESGWIAEMVIPFKSLRYAAGREQTWGIQLRRFMPGKNERAHLTQVSVGAGNAALGCGLGGRVGGRGGGSGNAAFR